MNESRLVSRTEVWEVPGPAPDMPLAILPDGQTVLACQVRAIESIESRDTRDKRLRLELAGVVPRDPLLKSYWPGPMFRWIDEENLTPEGRAWLKL